ncbi:hypothetical protein CB1_002145011 [Camelus ferus]|nr:hypothetical protein CB1_002145011 [Camelus ferus]
MLCSGEGLERLVATGEQESPAPPGGQQPCDGTRELSSPASWAGKGSGGQRPVGASPAVLVDLGMESTSLDDVLYRYASFRNLVDPITHDLVISLARYIHCPKPPIVQV